MQHAEHTLVFRVQLRSETECQCLAFSERHRQALRKVAEGQCFRICALEALRNLGIQTAQKIQQLGAVVHWRRPGPAAAG